MAQGTAKGPVQPVPEQLAVGQAAPRPTGGLGQLAACDVASIIARLSKCLALTGVALPMRM